MLHNRSIPYTEPELELVLLATGDILTASTLPELIIQPDGDGDVFDW